MLSKCGVFRGKLLKIKTFGNSFTRMQEIL